MPHFMQSLHFSLAGMDLFVALCLYFFAMAMIGWIIEMIYVSSYAKTLVNVGFFFGPVVPVYAFGALVIYLFSYFFRGISLPVQALLYAILATGVEYFTHIALERFYGIRLWDYSNDFANFQGRVSAKYTLFWFILVLALVFALQPSIVWLIQSLEHMERLLLWYIISSLMIADLVFSSRFFFTMRGLVSRLCELRGLDEARMCDLQFNRQLVVSQATRLKSLFADEEYRRFESAVGAALIADDGVRIEGVPEEDYLYLVDNPRYRAWRAEDPRNEARFRTYARVAELSALFCADLGLDRVAAVRAAFLAGYRPERGGAPQRFVRFFVGDRLAYRLAAKDLGSIGPKERDIVLRYLWPLNVMAFATRECLIVSFAHKLVTSREYRRELVSLMPSVKERM